MKTELGKQIDFAPKTLSGMVQTPDTLATASETYVMQGLALALTPKIATRIWVTANGQLTNSKSNGMTDAVLCYGAGSPPSNGDPLIGTILTQPAHFVSTTGTGLGAAPFSLTATFAGIVPETTYWFDLAVKVSPSSTGNVVNVDACAMGLP